MQKETTKRIQAMDNAFIDENFRPDPVETQELLNEYRKISDKFKEGGLIKGQVVAKHNDGLTISIDFKSDGFIPAHEFSTQEFARFVACDPIEVMIDALEGPDDIVALSYQKAKALKVWNEILTIAEQGGSITGRVTHRVKGGLNVDVGVPAFLPGSQVDVHRVSDFDKFLGQDVVCKVIKVNRKKGNIIVSRRKFIEEERGEAKRKTMEVLQEGQIIRGVVKSIANYGAFVDVGGIDGLVHVTDMSWGRIAHPSELFSEGDEVTVKVLLLDREHERISLGIKQLQDNPWQDIDKRFPVNSRIKGKVSSIVEYGLFVEIAPGVEGLVHISEVSWTERVQDLASRYKVGDIIDVVVTNLEKDDRRMSLSIKRLDNDPWKAAFDKFKPGDRLRGEVSNVTEFGIFVRIYPGVDGLVHVSDISWTDHINSPFDRYKKSDVIDVVVLSMEQDKRRISLGIKQLQKDPWEAIEEKYKVGSEVSGVVSKVTSFGVFVKFDDGLEGLAHISELSSKDIPDVAKFLPVGTRETFKVVKSSAVDRKLGLSLKAVREKGLEPEVRNNENVSTESVAPRPTRVRNVEPRSEKIGERTRNNARSEERPRHKETSTHKQVELEPTTMTESSMKGSLQLELERMKQANRSNKKEAEAPEANDGENS